MRKGVLKSGVSFLGVKIEHFVTKKVFALALSEYCYLHDKEVVFTKTEAKKILKRHLYFNGNGSEFKGLDDMGDEQDKLNELFYLAKKWVEINYTYLDKNSCVI